MTLATQTTQTRVKQALAEALKRPIEDLAEDQLLTDLVTESFALIEAVIHVQETLSIRLVQEDLRGVETVGDLLGACGDRVRS